MSLFGSKNKSKAVVLIDVTSSSIGGAYAIVSESAPAALLYTTRVALPTTGADVPSELMLRALDEVLQDLRINGAPILHRRTGSGSVQAVVASVGAPWQTTNIRTETVVEEKPFLFTDAIIAGAKKKGEIPVGRYSSEESVLATLLNGYETPQPVGKRAKRAEIILLGATMEEETAKLMRRALSSFSALHEVRFSGLASVVSTAVALAFPHEKEYLALRVSGEVTELVFVKRGHPMFVSHIPSGLNVFARAAKSTGYASFPDGGDIIDRTKSTELDAGLKEAEEAWTTAVATCLKEFTATHALPRTLFLIVDKEAREFIRRVLDVPQVHALWLSDEPLATIALECSHFSKNMACETGVEEDLMLGLLALVARS
ncbi:MAG TPA: hypothetical protein PK109_00375 [Candidatus Paceibacterota bacterium]|nr:hypothetical protein [Candidatus Paceibacterota bacterium]